MIKNSIFIVGYMHSGTSMLQNLISNHNGVYSPPGEVKFIEYLDSLIEVENINPNQLALFYLKCIYYGVGFTKYFKQKDIIPQNELDVLGGVVYSSNHLENFFHTLNVLRDYKEKELWLEKSPNNIFYSELIFQYIENPKFIGIIRDSRDVVASKKTRQATLNSGRYSEDQIALKKLEKHSAPIIDALSWRSTARQIITKSYNQPLNFMFVPYEGFVSAPEEYTKRIFQFIGLTFYQEVMEFSFSNAADPNQKKEKGVSKVAVGRYNSVLSQAEICAVQWLTRKELKQLNLSMDKISFGAKCIAVWYFIRLPYDLLVRLSKRFKMLGKGNFSSFIKTMVKKVKSV
jgi:hypothetical protein